MNIVIQSITLVMSIIAVLLSVASLVFKKKAPKGDEGKDGIKLTSKMIEDALTDSDGRIQFSKPVAAPDYYETE